MPGSINYISRTRKRHAARVSRPSRPITSPSTVSTTAREYGISFSFARTPQTGYFAHLRRLDRDALRESIEEEIRRRRRRRRRRQDRGRQDLDRDELPYRVAFLQAPSNTVSVSCPERPREHGREDINDHDRETNTPDHETCTERHRSGSQECSRCLRDPQRSNSAINHTMPESRKRQEETRRDLTRN